MLKRLGLIVLSLALGLFVYSFVVVYQAGLYADSVVLKDYENGKWRIYGEEERDLTLKIDDFKVYQIGWLLRIQDPNYFDHDGIDLSTPGAGLTTVTQSIVKKLYFNQFSPGVRKYKQSLIARFVVNERLDKNEQLRIFVNSVYMGVLEGEEIYGLAQSSRAYFGKELNQLNDDEYLSLVAMLIGPNPFRVLSEPENNRDRVSRIKAVLSGEYKPKCLTDVYYNRK